MKSALLMGLVSLAASVSFAGQRENFKTCAANDSSWMRRFGNYVVAFDLKSAYAECQRTSSPGGYGYRVVPTGCYVGGQWLDAGYYCDEVSPGG